MKKLLAAFAIIAGSVFVAIPAALAEDVAPPTDPSLTTDSAPTGDPALNDPAPAGDPALNDPAPAGDPAPAADTSSSKVTIQLIKGEKVFVCKYVGTPGVDERLQTGDNPISVSVSAITGPGPVVPGYEYFADEQGRSVVLAFDTGQKPEPDVSACLPKVVTPEEPTTTPATCDKDGTLVLPTTEGVVYTVDPDYHGPDTYTVTATAVKGGFPGFVLADGATTEFEVTVDSKLTGDECEEDEEGGPLPDTGGQPLWLLLVAGPMIAGGVMLLRKPQAIASVPSYRLDI